MYLPETHKVWLATGETPIYLEPGMANRHGLIAGATGTGKTVTLSANKTGVPTTNEAKLIAYASSYQDVVSGGTVTAPTAYFNVKVAVSQNAKLNADFRVRKVIGTQNEYDNCDEDVIDGVASTAENLKGCIFR